MKTDDTMGGGFRPFELDVMPKVHVYAPQPIRRFVHAGTCPDCSKRTRFIGWSYEWHGPTAYCLRCGREWQDGEWMALPFMRGARAHNIRMAKAWWRKIGHNAGAMRLAAGGNDE